jgi:hypothetical protein
VRIRDSSLHAVYLAGVWAYDVGFAAFRIHTGDQMGKWGFYPKEDHCGAVNERTILERSSDKKAPSFIHGWIPSSHSLAHLCKDVANLEIPSISKLWNSPLALWQVGPRWRHGKTNAPDLQARWVDGIRIASVWKREPDGGQQGWMSLGIEVSRDEYLLQGLSREWSWKKLRLRWDHF